MVSVDLKRNLFSDHYSVLDRFSLLSKHYRNNPVEFISFLSSLGVGEFLVTIMDLEGTCRGLDLNLFAHISRTISVPIIASGGLSSFEEILDARRAGISAVAAGSFCVFKGSRDSVLLTYPTSSQLSLLY